MKSTKSSFATRGVRGLAISSKDTANLADGHIDLSTSYEGYRECLTEEEANQDIYDKTGSDEDDNQNEDTQETAAVVHVC
jgi:hypothetical protein